MFRIVVTSPRGEPSMIHCAQAHCLVGKGEENLVVLPGWSIGRVHAELRYGADGVFLHDKGSRSGTWVNGKRVSQHGPLKSTDEIRIGSYSLIVYDDQRTRATADAVPEKTESGPHAPAVPEPLSQLSESIHALFAWRRKIHQELLRQMDLRRTDVNRMSEEELRQYTQALVQEILARSEDLPGDVDRQRLLKEVLDEAIGLGPLEDLLADERITEIMVNRHDEIYIEREGRLESTAIAFTSDQAVMGAIERIVAPLGRRIDESSPMVDARLRDGSRVNAVIPPLALRGPCLTIRKFPKRRLGTDDLIRFGSMNEEMVSFLRVAVEQRRNIVISGGTGSGKTTLLNVLSNFIPQRDRIVTIEDAAELRLGQPNRVSLEARPPNLEGKGQVSIRDLVRNALRMRPDRIVVGECRGGEALDMLQAMNTGHDGSLTTAHANSPRDVLSRLEVMVLMAGMDLPVSAIREQIASAIDLIVHQSRFSCGARKVTHICEVTGVESGTILLQDLFVFRQEGFNAQGGVSGRFVATGAIPEFYEDLQRRGIRPDLSPFQGEEILA